MTRVLIVDDNDVDRILVRRLLGAGYQLVEAGSARAAMERFDEETPDAVLLDQRLPDQDGIDLIPALAGRSAVILMTGHHVGDLAARARAAGATGYLVKEFTDPAPLRRELEAAIARFRGRSAQ